MKVFTHWPPERVKSGIAVRGHQPTAPLSQPRAPYGIGVTMMPPAPAA